MVEKQGREYVKSSEWDHDRFSENAINECFTALFKGKNWVYDGIPVPSGFYNALSLKCKGIAY